MKTQQIDTQEAARRLRWRERYDLLIKKRGAQKFINNLILRNNEQDQETKAQG